MPSVCGMWGPGGTRCEIRKRHVGSHGGMDSTGEWVTWQPATTSPASSAVTHEWRTGAWPHWKDESMSERASQTAQRYVDAMNIASAKIEQLQAEVEALRARNETLIATIQRQDSTFERQMEEHEELEALRAQVQRVRELHHPVPGFNGSQWCDAACEATCDGDPTEWPCATIRILDGGDA